MQLFSAPTQNRTKPPLPFNGNKKNFLKDFLNVLKGSLLDLNQYTIVDLFWGSGFLSHHCKKHRPNARVIYNDFDDYKERCSHIPETEKLRKRIYENTACNYEDKMKLEEKDIILTKIKDHQQECGYLDFDTVSNWLLFSGNSAQTLEDFNSQSLFNHIPKSPLTEAWDYFEGLEVVKKDYQELIKEHTNKPNTLFLFDPPYLNTDNARYNIKDQRWLKDYLDIIPYLKGKEFIFFTSEKSSMLEFIERCKEKWLLGDINYQVRARTNSVSKGKGYQDIMIYNI